MVCRKLTANRSRLLFPDAGLSKKSVRVQGNACELLCASPRRVTAAHSSSSLNCRTRCRHLRPLHQTVIPLCAWLAVVPVTDSSREVVPYAGRRQISRSNQTERAAPVLVMHKTDVRGLDLDTERGIDTDRACLLSRYLCAISVCFHVAHDMQTMRPGSLWCDECCMVAC